jgi:hypothetical protein
MGVLSFGKQNLQKNGTKHEKLQFIPCSASIGSRGFLGPQ